MKERDKKKLKKFGAHLAKLRKAKKISQRGLATRCDVDYGKVSKIESGKANLNITTLFEIAEGLEVHPKELLDMNFE